MHIDVDALGWDVDEQHIRWLPTAMEHVFIRRAHAVRDQLVANEAAVDVDVLLIGPRACRRRRARTTADAQHAEVEHQRAAVLDELAAEQVAKPRFGGAAPPLLCELAVMPQREA